MPGDPCSTPSTLPATGRASEHIALIAGACLAVGVGLVLGAKRKGAGQ